MFKQLKQLVLSSVFLALLLPVVAGACIDSDGLDVASKGYVVEDGISYIDYCAGGTLREYYCLGEKRAMQAYSCTVSCQEGVCEQGLVTREQNEAPPLWPVFVVVSVVAVVLAVYFFAVKPAAEEVEDGRKTRIKDLRERVLKRARGET